MNYIDPRFNTMEYDEQSDAWVWKPGMSVSEPVKIDPKDMKVKCETVEDRERLWAAVKDYAAS
jgi:hypothetical protein